MAGGDVVFRSSPPPPPPPPQSASFPASVHSSSPDHIKCRYGKKNETGVFSSGGVEDQRGWSHLVIDCRLARRQDDFVTPFAVSLFIYLLIYFRGGENTPLVFLTASASSGTWRLHLSQGTHRLGQSYACKLTIFRLATRLQSFGHLTCSSGQPLRCVSSPRSSPSQSQPRSRFAHLTRNDSTSRLAKLSRNSCGSRVDGRERSDFELSSVIRCLRSGGEPLDPLIYAKTCLVPPFHFCIRNVLMKIRLSRASKINVDPEPRGKTKTADKAKRSILS